LYLREIFLFLFGSLIDEKFLSFSSFERKTSQLAIGSHWLRANFLISDNHRISQQISVDLCRRTAVYKSFVKEKKLLHTLSRGGREREMSCELTGGHHHSINQRESIHLTHIHIWNHQLAMSMKVLMLNRLSNYINLRFLISIQHFFCPGVLSLLLTDDFSSPASKSILLLY
jgi:hypothetical protein